MMIGRSLSEGDEGGESTKPSAFGYGEGWLSVFQIFYADERWQTDVHSIGEIMHNELTLDAMHGGLLFVAMAVFLLAGFVKGVVGLGLPTVAVGLLGLFMSPMQAAALLLMPSLVTNVWQLLAGGQLMTLLRRLWPMLIGIVVGTVLGARSGMSGASVRATLALGIALMCYAALGLATVTFKVSPVHTRMLSWWVGLATGLISSVTAVFVIPAVPFLQALRLEKDELIQAMGWSFTVSTFAMGAVLLQAGMVGVATGGVSLLAVLPSLLGMFLGQFLRARISAQLFRRYFFLGVLFLGLHLSIQGWR
jgi:uncharacterized protein